MAFKIVIPAKHLRRDTFRAGGPGGQHQNKTESAVRYTHLPTGIAAESRTERSQSVNDENALALLHEKLLRVVLLKRGRSVRDAWARKPDVTFGAKMRTYKVVGQRRVTDHETGWEGDPGRVLNGDIDGLLKSRLMAALEADKEWSPAAPGGTR